MKYSVHKILSILNDFKFVIYVFLTMTLIFLNTQSAAAQGFQIKPMQMDIVIPSGRISETTLELSNTTMQNLALDVHVVELNQNSSGAWQIAAGSSAHPASATSWSFVERSTVNLAPSGTESVAVRFSPPAGASGTYVAGIVAEQPRVPDATGLVVRVRFLIPVIIQIEGRPVRQQVDLDDLRLTFLDGAEGGPRTSVAHVLLSNKGRTYSRLRGEVRVLRQSNDSWRPVTRYSIPERGIIPGASFDLTTDLERRLPSGIYRLRGEIAVDGRRIRPLEVDVEFQGDPEVDSVAYDTALVLTPEIVRVDITPGAVRTTTLTIDNPSQDAVEIQISADTPRELQNVAMGDLLGQELSAADWTEIRPYQFTLRGKGRQSVRLISRVPQQGVEHANYYADLSVVGRYADGQSAGMTRSTIHLANPSVTEDLSLLLERLLISEGNGSSTYVVQSRLVNTGNVHVQPEMRVSLLTGRGEIVASSRMNAEVGPLIPLGVRDYSGELELGTIEPGTYALRVTSTIDGWERARKQTVVRIEQGAEDSEQDGRKLLVILDEDSEPALTLIEDLEAN